MASPSHVDSPAVAPKDPESVDSSLDVPSQLGQRRGSLLGVREARDKRRSGSQELVSRDWKGSTKELRGFLEKHNVSELKTPSEVIQIDGALSTQEGFEVLLKHNILSAPVWDGESKSYTGFIDVRDLVASALHAYDQAQALQKPDIFLTVAVEHAAAPSLIYLSRRNPFKPVKEKANLFDVAKILSERHCHRVPVVDDNGVCVRIVSQSTLLEFIANHKDEVKEDLAQTFEAIHLGTKKVITISEEETAREAFRIIEKTGLSGIGVVDEENKLVGNTSARDIKYFVLDKGQLKMDEPVLDYLSTIRQRTVTSKEKAPISSVRKTDNLGRAIGLLGKTKYHRLFLVDEESHPIGVVSVSDILCYIVHAQQ